MMFPNVVWLDMLIAEHKKRTKAVEGALDNLNEVWSIFLEQFDDKIVEKPELVKEVFTILVNKTVFNNYKILKWDPENMLVIGQVVEGVEIKTYAKDLGNDDYEICSEILKVKK